MAKTTVNPVKPIQSIKPGTPEMEALLGAGYPDMTVEKAKSIIRERKENPQSWPYEMLERAQAFLAAYEASPIAIDKTPHWVNLSTKTEGQET